VTKPLPWLTRADALILLGAGLLLAGLYWQLWTPGGRSAEAQVLVNGRLWARLDLYQDQDLAVPGPLGVSQLQVRAGAVRFIDSPCPNRLCVLQGPLRAGGEMAVCLPNRVSVLIPAADPRFDAINF
jgi:hypothetical protein